MVWGKKVFEYIYGCSIHGSFITARDSPHKVLVRECICGIKEWQKTLDNLEYAIMNFRIHTRSIIFHEEWKRICTIHEFVRNLEDHLKI